MKYVIDGVTVNVLNGEISKEEATAYVERGRELHSTNLSEIIATLDPFGENDPPVFAPL